MRFTKTIIKYLFITVVIAVVFIGRAFADGFPLRPGRLIISPSVSYFFANTKWDSVGVKKPFPNSGHFSSLGVSLFAEYGLSRRFAVVATLPFVVNSYHQSNYSSNNSGLTDLETGLRYYIANIDFNYYFAVQGTLITPLYTNLNLGYDEVGAELKLSFAGRGHLFGKNSYFILEDGVRQYFGTAGPIQNRYNATYGLTLDKQFKEQVSVSVSGFYSASNNKQFDLLNPLNSKDFAFNQVSVGYGHTFDEFFSLFLSAGHFITGRNTGDGLTASASLIYRLDYR